MYLASDIAGPCRSALLHSSSAPRVSSLTDTISPEGSAKAGTFTPQGAGAALSCNIPELVRCLTWRL